MRKIFYLTQDEIDELVQRTDIFSKEYNRLRAFQDGDLKEVKTAFNIYRRVEDKPKNDS